ncbi:ABC transporter permease [Bosea thiooxidans]|nr:ABC transporter permease [Bosea sp. (in: a-proteobacteria)]
MNEATLTRTLAGVPIILLLLVFFALPLSMVLVLAFRPFDAQAIVGANWTLGNFRRFLLDSSYLLTLWRTVWISLTITVLTTVFGYPIAWHLNGLKSRSARLWLTLIVLLPLMTSLVVSSFAWVFILGNNGVVSHALQWLKLVDRPTGFLNTTTGVIIVSTYSYISFSILAIFATLQTINQGFARAAAVHGASPFQTFVRVILPLSIPGIVSGALIVFALSMAGFVVPFLIGGGRVSVIPLLIFQFTLQLFDWPGAAALGVILFVLTLGLTWAISTAAQRLTPWER